MQRYRIAYTWDGNAIPAQEVVSITIQHDTTGIHLCIDAPYYDDPVPDSARGSLWELWNHEVVEAFLVGQDGHYTELEFGPHGHYLVLRLNSPRSIVDKEHQIQYDSIISGQRWSGTAFIPATLLPTYISRLNFFSIHGLGKDRQYLCHSPLPNSHPDFHQPDRFPIYKGANQ